MPSENPGVISQMIITFSILTEVFLEWKDYSSSNTLYHYENQSPKKLFAKLVKQH